MNTLIYDLRELHREASNAEEEFPTHSEDWCRGYRVGALIVINQMVKRFGFDPLELDDEWQEE